MVTECQGQLAVENMLGVHVLFSGTPFFWSAHYDVTIRYVGHAEGGAMMAIGGDIAARDCTVRSPKDGQLLAVATIAATV